MGQENAVKKLGRVEYIEPNNLFVNSPGDKIQNGIPQPYENYSFSVNLRVISGDRYACGMTNDGGDITMDFVEYSSENGTLSFMDGTSVDGNQGYLTTNFTDISMNDPNTNTRECLGIERISIKYDSWFYPTVDIDFVDVRGASLMLPSEFEYYNNGGPNKGKNEPISNAKFFKAFFSFPYPLFKLSVKGFYGKELTYDLSVLSCNVSFNSSTGNFEIHASFIGYMYGMYADLPFPFVYLAPYVDLYGKKTWDEKRETGDFCYIEIDSGTSESRRGKAMYTFPELKRAVEDAAKNGEKEEEITPEGIEKIELKKLIEKLEKEALFDYPPSSKNFVWWSWSQVNIKENRKGYFFIVMDDTPENNLKVFTDFYKFGRYMHEYSELVENSKSEFCRARGLNQKPIFENVYKETEERKKSTGTKTSATAATDVYQITEADVNEIMNGKVVNLVFNKDESNKDKPVLIFDAQKSSFGSASQSEYTDLIDELKKRFDNDEVNSPMHTKTSQKTWNVKAFKFDNIGYKNELIEASNEMKSELNRLTALLDKKREQYISDAIGFKPTIKNLYNMVFAHIDTFMTIFYNTLDRIRKSIQSDDNSRCYDVLCGGNIQVDVNENSLKKKSGKLPPFTMFYKEETEKDSKDKKVTAIWPGLLKGGENLDEVKMVEAIINATALNRRSYEPVTPKDNLTDRKGDLVPTNYYDIMRNEGNPYLDILNEDSVRREEVVNLVLEVFLYRCFYSLMNGSYVSENKDGTSTSTSNFTKKAKLVAELEVTNVIRAFESLKMNPGQNFINQLIRKTNDGASLATEFLNADIKKFTAIGSSGDFSYIGLDTGTFKCLPVGTFNVSELDNYAKGAEKLSLADRADKFLLINKNGTLLNGDHCVKLYGGGKYLESVLDKYSHGDFASATKLFPNYKKVPGGISGISFCNEIISQGLTGAGSDFDVYTFDKLYEKIGNESSVKTLPSIPSARRTSAGVTSIFMDPLYYAQTTPEARAYLFLMGIPYGKDKKFFLPKNVENGDYPTLLLLREGAVQWRNDFISYLYDAGAPLTEIEGDPITYKYMVNGVEVNTIDDIEANDPCFGIRYAAEFYNIAAENASEGRKKKLIDYFLKWVNGEEKERRADVVAKSYFTKEIPDAPMSFSTIEKTFGLCEMVYAGESTIGGEAVSVYESKILSPSSCSSAITVENVGDFSNSAELRLAYNIGPDSKLGKTNGKIRTGVFLKNEVENNEATEESHSNFLKGFKKLYLGFDTILDYSCLDVTNPACTVPRSAINDALSAFVLGLKDAYKASVESYKEEDDVDGSGKVTSSFKNPEQFTSDKLKLACYIALKNLYDRWICNRRREFWTFSCDPKRMVIGGSKSNFTVRSDFGRFFYIDEFYHDIGMKIRPNLTKFVNMTEKLGGITEKVNEANLAASSIIKVLSTTGQYAGCSLLTLPTMLGMARTYCDDDMNSIEDVFKAYSYNDSVRKGGLQSSFIVLYSNQKSSVLNVKDESGKMAYKTDGFDIANTWGEIVPQPMFADSDENGFVVPAFGVTFAKQNQSYFKDVKLSMNDHQITEYSIMNEVQISYQSNKGPRETSIVGQDLFSVYSNYSYSCDVTMMGDAQITPLMYFQLNNIPMWKGAYMITNVQHTISNAGMETTFKGVRQARPSLPFTDDDMNIPASDAAEQTPQSQNKDGEGKPMPSENSMSERPLQVIDVNNVETAILYLDRISLLESSLPPEEEGEEEETDYWISGLLSLRVYYKDREPGSQPEIFRIANTLEATTGLTGRIEDFTPEQNSTLFSIPSGRFALILAEYAPPLEEFRKPSDTFFNLVDRKHITISDFRMGTKRCEIIPGEKDYEAFTSGGYSNISFGGTTPIMIYECDPKEIPVKYTEDLIKAKYFELYDFVQRMNDAKKPLSLFVNEREGLGDKF